MLHILLRILYLLPDARRTSLNGRIIQVRLRLFEKRLYVLVIRIERRIILRNPTNDVLRVRVLLFLTGVKMRSLEFQRELTYVLPRRRYGDATITKRMERAPRLTRGVNTRHMTSRYTTDRGDHASGSKTGGVEAVLGIDTTMLYDRVRVAVRNGNSKLYLMVLVRQRFANEPRVGRRALKGLHLIRHRNSFYAVQRGTNLLTTSLVNINFRYINRVGITIFRDGDTTNRNRNVVSSELVLLPLYHGRFVAHRSGLAPNIVRLALGARPSDGLMTFSYKDHYGLRTLVLAMVDVTMINDYIAGTFVRIMLRAMRTNDFPFFFHPTTMVTNFYRFALVGAVDTTQYPVQVINVFVNAILLAVNVKIYRLLTTHPSRHAIRVCVYTTDVLLIIITGPRSLETNRFVPNYYSVQISSIRSMLKTAGDIITSTRHDLELLYKL